MPTSTHASATRSRARMERRTVMQHQPTLQTAQRAATHEVPAAMRERGRWARARRHLAGSTSGKLGLALVGALVLMALLAPLIAPHDPYEHHTRFRLLGPSLYFPFGTDEFGRDIFSRVLFGARISLQVGVISVAIALVAGGLLGLIAGFRGGWVDAV